MYCEQQQVCCACRDHLSGYTSLENTRFTNHLKSVYSAATISHCRSVFGLLIFLHFQDTELILEVLFSTDQTGKIPHRIVIVLTKLHCLEEAKLANSTSLLPEKILYSVEQFEEDGVFLAGRSSCRLNHSWP